MAYKKRVTDSPIRIARKRKKISLQALADELGVSLGQMSRIERFGTKNFAHAIKIADRLKVNVRACAPSSEADA